MSGYNQLLMEMAQLAAGENNTAIKTIDSAHQRTHEGEMFAVGHRWENQADNASLTITVSVPAGVNIHCVWSAGATGKAYFDLYYGTTGVSGGTALTAMNKNTASDRSSTATVLRDVTVADYNALTKLPISTVFGTAGAGGGPGGNAVGGSNGMDAEFDLNDATTWIFRIQNKGGAAQDLFLTLQYYDTAAA